MAGRLCQRICLGIAAGPQQPDAGRGRNVSRGRRCPRGRVRAGARPGIAGTGNPTLPSGAMWRLAVLYDSDRDIATTWTLESAPLVLQCLGLDPPEPHLRAAVGTPWVEDASRGNFKCRHRAKCEDFLSATPR